MSDAEMSREEAQAMSMTADEMEAELAHQQAAEDMAYAEKTQEIAEQIQTMGGATDNATDNATDKAVAKVEKQSNAVFLEDGGKFVPKTLDEAYRFAKWAVSTGMVPKSYTRPEMVVVGMQYAYELDLQPLTALRQIAVINGVPSIFGDLPLALVRKSGQLEYIKEFLIDKDYNVICVENKNLTAQAWGAVCKLKRKGDPEEREVIFTTEDAKLAGVGNVHNKYPNIMKKYRARSQALKDVFPDVLNGISIAEYDYNVMPGEAKVINGITHEGKADKVSKMNEKFGG